MTERPILFSGPMVRALLDGRKTQTRRIIKPQPDWDLPEPCCSTTVEGWQGPIDRATWACNADPTADLRRCPYGGPGDSLWVKETWRPRPAQQDWDLDVRYAADGEVRTIKDGEFGDRDWLMPKAARTGNVSPLFMPRWASRLTLDITDIKAERLQDISEADALAEGTQEPSLRDLGGDLTQAAWSERHVYSRLWKHINGPTSWDANPWVWAVTFTVRT
tara:strand:+ start:24048 stop:24704 length:657 start_codon:yes stop_codon:yes gene_type:complete